MSGASLAGRPDISTTALLDDVLRHAPYHIYLKDAELRILG